MASPTTRSAHPTQAHDRKRSLLADQIPAQSDGAAAAITPNMTAAPQRDADLITAQPPPNALAKAGDQAQPRRPADRLPGEDLRLGDLRGREAFLPAMIAGAVDL
ncbi:hypothetical protein [Asanoa iriomotensis]|uniref:Uncharacterized protein n=1 Tax=Asanoa iriomotensis TaxID=234613 RepID=A0ABQ4C0J0_9ACTN|nr:hypothetical protein [Asanoa iriomotensis]GIF56297.1 hypothetical protein Air01nite_23920 [Asanoa iriomotensis]